ncbi:Hypothetical protein ADU72_1766 [Pediococcus damnosus]|uniref:Uncharacterized protein n=1 Tax=Pediococcus damnosus TaxID=51663 RepID=A0A0R2HKK4_9LACO|nr:DUF1054 family protein [Pediococcus damnosus]AMV61239.1 Hypothetical protein ADU69_1588 [Pediococcus damnosus]AMV62444.1 Hypothetical protein ADU70_0950 [Pediococcus damnosus]AMV65599.1 Hypothetical protein ADU71_1709 [Pediococcus damnosus]AMV67691.1 Hypothetical protein ADU72_1766 [Pediococcus damnosus]AMV68980.1 Hypothetical protein ADU73_0572 [Pediococcus damnosus]
MFSDRLFSVFKEPDVEGRLALIRKQVDPFFEEVSQQILPILNTNDHQYQAFIAKHARRHVNPPMNTWVAFGEHKRGYKMIPHYEVGIWDDRLFIWLDLETNIQERETVIKKLKQKQTNFLDLGAPFVLSNNHMIKGEVSLTPTNYENQLSNYEKHKQAEFLIGRCGLDDELQLKDEQEVMRLIERTIQQLAEIWDK